MNTTTKFTSAEIKLIDRALKVDWKRKKRILQIGIIIMIICAVASVLQQPFNYKNLKEAWPIMMVACIGGILLEQCKFLELIKKLAMSNVDKDTNIPNKALHPTPSGVDEL